MKIIINHMEVTEIVADTIKQQLGKSVEFLEVIYSSEQLNMGDQFEALMFKVITDDT